MIPLTYPPAPLPLLHEARKGGDERSRGILRLSPIPRSRTTPLPHCGRGAGGEGDPLTFPLAPLPLPRCGRGRGDDTPHLPPCPLPLPRCGRGRGDDTPHLPPGPPSAPTRGEEGGGTSGAGAISRPRSPLSRSAGEGLGVRAIRSAGEGLGVRATRSAEAGPGVRATPSPFPHSSLGCRYHR